MEAYYEKMLALAETIAVNAHKSQLEWVEEIYQVQIHLYLE